METTRRPDIDWLRVLAVYLLFADSDEAERLVRRKAST